MTRVSNRSPRALPGGVPDIRTLTLREACQVCDAPTGERCRVWRKFEGKRLYVKGVRVKFHPERIAAAGSQRGDA